jgi:hypothetical protein
MFWKSIVGSLYLFLHWELWFALVTYMGLFFLFNWVVFKLSDNNENKSNLGCFFEAIFGPFYEGITIGLFMMLLLPLVFGNGGLPSVSLMFGDIPKVALASVISVFGLFILSIIPIVGGLMKTIPTIYKFIQGVIVFRILIGGSLEKVASSVGFESVQYPGLFASVGYFVIAAILGSTTIAVLYSSLESSAESELASNPKSSVVGVILPTVGAFMGLFPLVMYMKYVRLSMGY